MNMLNNFATISIATRYLQEGLKTNTNYENEYRNNTIDFFPKRHKRNQKKKVVQIKINTKTLSTMLKR